MLGWEVPKTWRSLGYGWVRRRRTSVWTLKYITGTCDTKGEGMEVSMHSGMLISTTDSHLSLLTAAREINGFFTREEPASPVPEES